MKSEDVLECAESVYQFLLDDTSPKNYSSFEDIPAFSNMTKTLKKHNTDMVPFTMYLNGKYHIHESWLFDIILTKSPKEFFSTTKAKDFYKSIIRNLKIELLCQKDPN